VDVPVERSTHVVVLDLEQDDELVLLRAAESLVDVLGKRAEVVGVAAAQIIGFAPSLELVDRVLPDRLEHRDAVPKPPYEALVEQRLERVEVGGTDIFGCLERAAAGENRQTREQLLLVVRQELVAPLDRRAQRPLALRQVTRARGEELEAVPEPLEDLPRRQHLHTRRGELERQRQPVETARDVADVLVRLERRL
jgi:hypothetical protein